MIQKTIISKVFSMPPIMKFLAALAGIFIIASFVIITRTVTTETNVSDQYDAIAVWQNKGEGNWDIAYSIYRQSDNAWLHQADNDIYSEGDANLIAKLPGDDNDPDIASTRNMAMAVWSNAGMSGNKGSDIIVSKWDSSGWSEPVRLFAIDGNDSDPTIYMQDDEHALVVWVNRSGSERSLFYSEYTEGFWSDPLKIPFEGATQIAVPELGYVTVSNSRYLLVFTARVENVGSAYTGTYDAVNGWDITKVESPVQAVTDESVPAKYRTSAIMQIGSHNVFVGWSGQDENVWYMKAFAEGEDLRLEAKNAGAGINPAFMYNSGGKNGVDTILFSSSDELVNITPIGGNLRQTVSSNEPSIVRPDGAYLWEQDRMSAVSVWATQKEGESEIYFSAVEKGSQKWTSPNRIDSKVFSGEDANPAIAPVIIQFTEENTIIEDNVKSVYEDAFCGDKILQKKFGEECEVNIACRNVDEICDWDYFTKKYGKKWAWNLSSCECFAPDDEIATPNTPKKGEDEDNGNSTIEEIVYGGASCGFDSVLVKSGIDSGQVSLQFLPGTNPSNGITVFKGEYPKYQTESFALFPLSTPPHDKYFVMANFSNNDDVITMIGIDATTGFQLCTGIFTKGAPPEGGPFVPASSEDMNYNVPSFPGS